MVQKGFNPQLLDLGKHVLLHFFKLGKLRFGLEVEPFLDIFILAKPFSKLYLGNLSVAVGVHRVEESGNFLRIHLVGHFVGFQKSGKLFFGD